MQLSFDSLINSMLPGNSYDLSPPLLPAVSYLNICFFSVKQKNVFDSQTINYYLHTKKILRQILLKLNMVNEFNLGAKFIHQTPTAFYRHSSRNQLYHHVYIFSFPFIYQSVTRIFKECLHQISLLKHHTYF